MVNKPLIRPNKLFLLITSSLRNQVLRNTKKRPWDIIPYHSWDWCIFTYIYHILPLKTTIYVGKYTVRPMDGMGIVTAHVWIPLDPQRCRAVF